jgi:cytidine deaminase
VTHTGPAEVGNRPPHAELVAAARRVRANAHAPWSGFAVGAALATTSGAVFCGVNVESVALPAGVCAERGALAAAVAGGHRDFAVLAVAGPGAQPSPPCGVCRQALAEFDGELVVLAAGETGEPISWRLDELLPHAFAPQRLDR